MEKAYDYLSGIYSRASDTYDEEDPKYYAYFGRKLANFSPISHEMNVLDIASGRGAVFYAVYEELSHYGCLIGIDFSDGMVDKLNNEILAYKLQNAVILKMNAEKLDFPDEFFDLITCGFAIFFMNTNVFTAIKRVLKPSGYFTFSTWMKDFENEDSWYEKILNKYIPQDTSESSNQSVEEEDDFYTTEGIEALLTKHHFRLIKMATDIQSFVYPNAEAYWNKLWSHGTRRSLEKIPEDKIEEFKKEIFDTFNSIKTENGLEVRMGVIFVCCSKFDIDLI